MPAAVSALRGLAFDFDGTLIDSYAAHLNAWKATFHHFGLGFDEREFRSCFSPDWYRVYEALGLERRHWREADAFWLKSAENDEPDAFPGVDKALQELGQNYALAIVTGGSRSRVLQDLERIGLRGHFSALVASEDAPRPKPAPDGLRIALEQLGVEPAEALYVGDARADLEMAQGLSVRFVGVDGPFRDWAFGEGQLVLSSVTELPGLLSQRGFRQRRTDAEEEDEGRGSL